MSEPTWDPAVLARVRHLHLQARMHTEALLMGEHRSRRHGEAVEFAGYQAYLPGMDLRFLDWRVWGRSDRLVIKQFEIETELPTTIILDLSADMATGDPVGGRRGLLGRRRKKSLTDHCLPDLDKSKAGYAIRMAATLLYFFQLHSEPVGLEIIGGQDAPFSSFPPRSGRSHLHSLFLSLAKARPGGVAQLRSALLRTGGRTRRRGLVMVITDGMEEPSTWLPSISAFARRRTDLRFFHVYDRREWGLAFGSPSKFYSPESGEELAVDPDAARSAFREVAEEYVNEVRTGLVQWGARYVPSPSDASLQWPLREGIMGVQSPARSPFDEVGA